MTIGKFPSFSVYNPDGTTKHFFRNPENDSKELELMEEKDPHFANIRKRLLGYKKYEKQIRKYLGRRDYCKYCYGNRFYDIDWFDGVIDCRNCGYHIESIEMIIDVLRDDGKIPSEPESESVSRID
jgi:hypothetical protein